MAPALYAPFESAVLALLVSLFVAVAFFIAPDGEGDTFDLIIFALPAGTVSTFLLWWWLGAKQSRITFGAYILGGVMCLVGAVVLNLAALTFYGAVVTGGFAYSFSDLSFYGGLMLLNGVALVVLPGALAATVFAFVVRPWLRRRYGVNAASC